MFEFVSPLCRPVPGSHRWRAARVGPAGELVLLADQDRAVWDQPLVFEGLARATAGLHASAPSWETTDRPQVVRMYDALLCWPSPVVALNRLAALCLVLGGDLDAVLAEVDGLGLTSGGG